MWDSRDVPSTWNWNVMDVGPKRQFVGRFGGTQTEFFARRHTVTSQSNLGAYQQTSERFNLLDRRDQTNQFKTNDFVTQKTIPELYDLVQKYEPELIWSDGDWDAHSDYWHA
jgi:alpha-L-fucosidase